jgi:hypothetical protein
VPGFDQDVLVTPKDVAEMLVVTERTLQAWRNGENNQRGPGWVVVGGQIRYWRSDVLAWLEERRMSS